MSRISKLVCGFIVFAFTLVASAAEPDWTGYTKLLSTHVKKGSIAGVDLMRVDYINIKNDPDYQMTLDMFTSFDTNKLRTDKERLAFYINAYNILAIKMVIDHWPVEGIKEIGNFFSPVWKKDVGMINRQIITLHHVEHEILRKMGDPRIHMAIVCASVSCPDLRDEAYTANQLDQQLDDQSRLFVTNSKKGVLQRGKTLHVSKIFDWFEDDFHVVGGVKKFIQRYRKDIPNNAEIDADIDYNWNLNKL